MDYMVMIRNAKLRNCFLMEPFTVKGRKIYQCVITDGQPYRQAEDGSIVPCSFEEAGLRATKQKDGFWYSQNAFYGNKDIPVRKPALLDPHEEQIEQEIGDDTIADILLVCSPYEADVNSKGIPYPAGVSARMEALHAIKLTRKQTGIDRLNAFRAQLSGTEGAQDRSGGSTGEDGQDDIL